MGVARYGDWSLSYGNRQAVITSTHPPSSYGGAELGDFVSPSPASKGMRSPLLDAVAGPPQIRRPRVAPSHTEFPSVALETRTSPHPRGSSPGGYVEPQRLSPGREPVAEPVRLSEEASWWRDKLT
jgi:hypothetical protein